jgi:ribosome-binding protein aMBF1 (putative translation factor)
VQSTCRPQVQQIKKKHDLALLTFTQRTIHVVLPIETRNRRRRKTIPTGTLGDAIRAARRQAGLTRQELAQATGTPLHWLGFWERDQIIPAQEEWPRLASFLGLPAKDRQPNIA